MDRFDFLAALLRSKGMGPTAAAALIKTPGAQGTISKFLARNVGDPRGTWAKELPRAMGFDPAALRDDDVARAEALRLGLLADGVAPLASLKAARAARQVRIDPGMLALQIADLMRAYSQTQRETAGALFQGAAKTPDEAPAIAAALRALLTKRTGRADDRARVLLRSGPGPSIHIRDQADPPSRGGRVHPPYMGVILMTRLAGLMAAALLAGCWSEAKPRRQPLAQPSAKVESSLELPGGDGRAHIVVMPTDPFESSRCLVAVGPNGQAAVACAPKGIDLPPDPPGER